MARFERDEGDRVVDLVGDARGELAHRGEATRGHEAPAQVGHLAGVAEHDHAAEGEPLLVAQQPRGRRDGDGAVAEALELALPDRAFGRLVEAAAVQPLGQGEAVELRRAASQQARQLRVDAADAPVEGQQRDAVGDRVEDLAGEGARREQRVAVPVEAPGDRRAEEGEGGRREVHDLDAEERQQPVGHARDHEGHGDAHGEPAELGALGGRGGGAERLQPPAWSPSRRQPTTKG